MVRGINRQVIEVTETNNLYYEKALLVIRTEYTGAQRSVLEKEARHMLKNMKPPSAIKVRSKVFYWGLRLGVSAVIGGVLSYLLMTFL